MCEAYFRKYAYPLSRLNTRYSPYLAVFKNIYLGVTPFIYRRRSRLTIDINIPSYIFTHPALRADVKYCLITILLKIQHNVFITYIVYLEGS